ncbi:MAG: Ppx/GppA family phosphatase [Flavobacteriaceae bacterium]|nr:Ppx/GppA family phosphatase [Flavobacteriaceae bacterium]
MNGATAVSATKSGEGDFPQTDSGPHFGSAAQRDGDNPSAGRRKKRRRKRSSERNSSAQSQIKSAAGEGGSPQPASPTAAGDGVGANNAQDSPSAGGNRPQGSGKRRRKRRRSNGPPSSAQAGFNPATSGQPNAEALAEPGEVSSAVSGSVSGAGDNARPQASNDRPHQEARKRGPAGGDRRANGRRPGGRPGAGYYRRDAITGPLYAALDLGTNNCRLLVAQPEARGFRVVDAFSRIVRLGEGIDANKRLGEAAMDRAIGALAMCHNKLGEYGVLKSRLIATEACRAAENGAEFIERVQRETGLALEIVDRETEARLAVAGCTTLVDNDADGVILFDIGGGSSEIVWLDLRNRCGARGFALTRFIRSWTSLPVGVVNLAERHGGLHVTPEIFEAMVDDVGGQLEASDFGAGLDEAIGSENFHMLGTSGTVTTLAGVQLGLKRYDRRRVDGTWLQDTQVGEMIACLRDMSYEDRIANPCIGADRADLVLAGCAILEAIRRRWSCSRLRVADRGLREGILTELMAADGCWSRRRPGRGNNRQRGRT